MRGRNPDAPPEAPSAVRHHSQAKDSDIFGFAVWQLKDGEDKIIANRLAEIFSAAPKA
jgi:hypothetical protein